MIRRHIRHFPRIWRTSRLLRRWYYARQDAYPDWPTILRDAGPEWQAAREAAKDGQHVLLGSSVGAYAHAITLESALAVALTLRGAKVHALLCDSAVPACAECEVSLYPKLERFVEHGPKPDLCRDCLWPAEAVYRSLGIETHRLGDWITHDDRLDAATRSREIALDQIPGFELDGLKIGEHAKAGALRFFASGSLETEPQAEAVLRRYLEAALLTAAGTRRLLQAYPFTSLNATHGIYVPWGIMGEVARQQTVRLVTWNVAYRKRRFIFSHGDTYHHTLMQESQRDWENMALSSEREQSLMSYLSSRREGMFDWIVFHRSRKQDAAKVADEVGLDPTRPAIGLLTNVSWDAQLHYPANAFPNMLEWFVQTVEYFAKRTELQLLVRVHPAEISGFPVSRQPILAELAKRVPTLPPNVIVVPPESDVSTYALMSLCNAAIIYGTKMGVELTSVGLPVIVAGEAWIRNKGLTLDAGSPKEYFEILDRLPLEEKAAPERVSRARKYAYHFFFRRMIPLGWVEPKAGYPIYRLKLDSIDHLRPGKTPGLDVICDGILHGTPFVYDEPAPHAKAKPAHAAG